MKLLTWLKLRRSHYAQWAREEWIRESFSPTKRDYNMVNDVELAKYIFIYNIISMLRTGIKKMFLIIYMLNRTKASAEVFFYF